MGDFLKKFEADKKKLRQRRIGEIHWIAKESTDPQYATEKESYR